MSENMLDLFTLALAGKGGGSGSGSSADVEDNTLKFVSTTSTPIQGNPTAEATEDLNKILIGDTVYNAGGGMTFYKVDLEQTPELHFTHDGETLNYTQLAEKYRDENYFLYCEYASITFIPSLPPDDDPTHEEDVLEFSAVWNYDGEQRISTIKINSLNEIKVDEFVCEIKGNVEPNPTDTASTTLTRLKIGNTVYNVGSKIYEHFITLYETSDSNRNIIGSLNIINNSNIGFNTASLASFLTQKYITQSRNKYIPASGIIIKFNSQTNETESYHIVSLTAQSSTVLMYRAIKYINGTQTISTFSDTIQIKDDIVLEF